jgi:hypothetical protein
MSEPPPAAEPPDAGPGAPARAEQQHEPAERYGIVVVERLVKDDGRSLLLYSRDRQDAR